MRKLQFLIVLGAALTCAVLLSSCNAGTTGSGKAMTKNGFEYIHHKANGGKTPQIGEYAYFNYALYVDDSLVETSQTRGFMPKMKIPSAEEVQGKPSPIVDGLQLMAVNDSLTIIFPLDSMDRRPPQFANNTNLNYHISLVEIKDQAGYDADLAAEKAEQDALIAAGQAREAEVATMAAATLASYKANKFGDQLKTTATGLKYIVHEEGNGPITEQGQKVEVHYYGTLTSDGSMFDNSFKVGKPYPVALGTGSVIPGWDEGLALLKRGTKATFFIPPSLGYGERGSPPVIPPNAELQFYVELGE